MRSLFPFLLAATAACAAPAAAEPFLRVVSPLTHPGDPALPEGARPDQCYAQEITPAVIETVTRKRQLTPPRRAVDLATGKTEIIREATWETVTERRVLREREERVFETVCPHLLTPRFVRSLQRALAARGLYAGTPTGTLDAPTRAALAAFQRAQGLPSSTLALETAERFGLVPHRAYRRITGN